MSCRLPRWGESEPDRASDRFLTGDVILQPAGTGFPRPTLDPSSPCYVPALGADRSPVHGPAFARAGRSANFRAWAASDPEISGPEL